MGNLDVAVWILIFGSFLLFLLELKTVQNLILAVYVGLLRLIGLLFGGGFTNPSRKRDAQFRGKESDL